MLLPSLYAKITKGFEPLVNYNKSHVVTFNEYFEILQRRIAKIEATKCIKKARK
jgi:hypothetical protein